MRKKNKNNGQKHAIRIKAVWGISAMAAVLLISAVVVAVYEYKIHISSSNDGSGSAQVEDSQSNSGTKNLQEINSGNLDEIVNSYQNDIDGASGNEDKAYIHMERALILFDHGSVEYKSQILSDAYTAEKLYPSAVTLTFVYDIESRYGNTEVANEYMQKIKDTYGDVGDNAE